MDIKKQIKESLDKITSENSRRTKQYKKGLKEKIRVNIVEKGQTPAQNKGLIDRYYSAKPKGLNQMQDALLQGALK